MKLETLQSAVKGNPPADDDYASFMTKANRDIHGFVSTIRSVELELVVQLPLSALMEAITESAAGPKPFLPTNFTPNFSHK